MGNFRREKRECWAVYGRCQTCRKTSYPTRKLAKQAAKRLHPGDRFIGPYPCAAITGYWHIGHRSTARHW